MQQKRCIPQLLGNLNQVKEQGENPLFVLGIPQWRGGGSNDGCNNLFTKYTFAFTQNHELSFKMMPWLQIYDSPNVLNNTSSSSSPLTWTFPLVALFHYGNQPHFESEEGDMGICSVDVFLMRWCGE